MSGFQIFTIAFSTKLLVFYFFSFLCTEGVAQTISNCYVYQNEDNEFFGICNDTLFYRLRNGGGLITYTYFLGEFRRSSDTLIIQDGYFPVAETIASEKEGVFRNSEEVPVVLLDSNAKPLRFGVVNVKCGKNREYLLFLDSLGMIKIPASCSGKEIVLTSLLLGNSFRHKFKATSDSQFLIKLNVNPDFGIQNDKFSQRKWLKIVSDDDNNQIVLFDPLIRKEKAFEIVGSLKNKKNLWSEVLSLF